MNKALLVGRITRDLELRKTETNKSVLNLSIAINRGKDKEAEFVDVQCWEQRAEFLNNYACKGALISVIGRIESKVFTNKQGIKVKNTYVVAEEVSILNKPQQQYAPQPQPTSAVQTFYTKDIANDDNYPWSDK